MNRRNIRMRGLREKVARALHAPRPRRLSIAHEGRRRFFWLGWLLAAEVALFLKLGWLP